ncbi:replication initiator protein A [Neopusillimonas maritima]|jgi:hypothetical protein|uniref:Plasmid replication initiator-like protein n=1 Tax=Neopusillimonas maritima TaxID=2026239 RepID=A0ABX9MZ75_9BURK|nr:replication initiator protein A [Neopusillimonas maritima]RII83858.1 hypothetical protein CJO09_01035 [Neopusillimonas maritima]
MFRTKPEREPASAVNRNTSDENCFRVPEDSREALCLSPADRARQMEQRAIATLTSNVQARDAPSEVDYFVADIVDFSFKIDMWTLEWPLFTLEKKDIQIWRWTSADKKTVLEVSGGVLGRATMHDKAVLVYCVSQITAALNAGFPLSNRTVRFGARSFLRCTERGTRGDDYLRLRDSLKRLKETLITVETHDEKARAVRQVGFIDDWTVIARNAFNPFVMVEITLSNWFFSCIQKKTVLTVSPEYFSLGSFERRLYEIARKHCGRQAQWSIGLEQLRSKMGSRVVRLRRFEEKIKDVIKVDALPEYRLQFLASGRGKVKMVKFYLKDQRKYARRSLKA